MSVPPANLIVLSHQDVIRQLDRRAILVDIRTPRQYVQLHLTGALGMGGPRFGLPILAQDRIAPGSRIILIADTAVIAQPAASELQQMRMHVVGVLSAHPNTWEPKGLSVVRGIVVDPQHLGTFLTEYPDAEVVDVREEVECQAYPFALATRWLPFSQWPTNFPDGSLADERPIVFVSGQDDRSVLAAWYLFQRGFRQVGFLVGGVHRFRTGDHYDPKAIARTTARHGVFI